MPICNSLPLVLFRKENEIEMKRALAVKVIQEHLFHEFKIPESVSCAYHMTSLFLAPFNLDAISMTYLMLLVQTRFHLEIHPDFVSNYQHMTIDNLAKWISNSA